MISALSSPQMCQLLHYFCDCELKHRIESIVSFSDSFVSKLQFNQKFRYNELMQALNLSAAVTAKKTKEFRSPPQEQVRHLTAEEPAFKSWVWGVRSEWIRLGTKISNLEHRRRKSFVFIASVLAFFFVQLKNTKFCFKSKTISIKRKTRPGELCRTFEASSAEKSVFLNIDIH